MNTESVFPENDAEFDAVYAEEAAMVDASELIAAALVASGLSKTELARRLGVSKSEVSARLAGERNITVRKLAATLHVLGQSLELKVRAPLVQSAERQRYAAWTAPHEPHEKEGHRHATGALEYFDEWIPARRAN